ncbi:proteasome regulatory particle subunit [Grosmannia clavigera kw1407]|uniref:Proteasome regulatory particle subunit n=1 Tax=Grosmannia clavigera (strain kw1407 / UAMH 11150) TaxID=655863 RepID=F0XN67_GROCL|nr:proteasome regulatory particle subunit [Grosmannia clavigera kw1407]EFX00791.1 proteasome regulatory particle subunit [Grosmannia clavigera kw1407]
MAERQLTQILGQLKTAHSYADQTRLLSKAKLALLQLGALTPAIDGSLPAAVLALARETYEQGALCSIRAHEADAFTRYVQQLGPFYALPAAVLAPNLAERNKVTGLYLLLLLTQGLYGDFHSELEAISTREGAGAGVIEDDRYLGYPIRLERWLMEGSYDRVWKAMKQGEVPCEEYGVFSEILTSQIRSEIASSSERAYPSLPLSSTKSLLFLDSEGAVIQFAQQRGWTVRDGHIYFPALASTSAASGAASTSDASDDGSAPVPVEKEVSQMVIENVLGYARQLETIV